MKKQILLLILFPIFTILNAMEEPVAKRLKTGTEKEVTKQEETPTTRELLGEEEILEPQLSHEVIRYTIGTLNLKAEDPHHKRNI